MTPHGRPKGEFPPGGTARSAKGAPVTTMTRRTLFGMALAAAAGGALAQDFPSRPIKWVVPYLAGTSPDLTVRIVGEAMADILKQPVVVENRAGASGTIGMEALAKAAPDGLTLAFSAISPLTIHLCAQSKLCVSHSSNAVGSRFSAAPHHANGASIRS